MTEQKTIIPKEKIEEIKVKPIKVKREKQQSTASSKTQKTAKIKKLTIEKDETEKPKPKKISFLETLKKGKKAFVLVGMALVLGLTGYLNITLNNNASEVSNENVLSFFASTKIERVNARNEAVEILEGIIASDASTQENIDEANKEKLEIVEQLRLEQALEGLIMAKGFENVVVFTSNNNINVVVKASEITENERIQINTIVIEQTQKDVEEIKISCLP